MPPQNPQDFKFICRINGYGFYRPNQNAQTILVEHPEFAGYSATKQLPQHLRGNLDAYTRDELKEELYEAFYVDAWVETH